MYNSRLPLWQSGLSSLGVEQFARVGGAAIYGINTAFGLPVMTPVGVMVAVLYSTENMSRDAVWEKKCIEFCKTLRPEPQWKLVIEVGLKNDTTRGEKRVQVNTINYAETVKPRAVSVATPRDDSVASASPNISASSRSCIVPVSPLPAAAKAVVNEEEPSYVWNEQSLALLLGKYMPLESASATLSLPSVSLRLLLLRHASCRTSFEISLVNTIMKKCQTYIQAAKHTEYEIMNLIMNDWKYLVASKQVSTASAKRNVNNTKPDNTPSSSSGGFSRRARSRR